MLIANQIFILPQWTFGVVVKTPLGCQHPVSEYLGLCPGLDLDSSFLLTPTPGSRGAGSSS